MRVELGSLPNDGPIQNAAVGFVGFRGFRAYSAGEILTHIDAFFGGSPDSQVTDANAQATHRRGRAGQRKPAPRYAHPVREDSELFRCWFN
jgi:hypothetical protein